MKTKVNKNIYAWDSFGGCSELIMIRFETESSDIHCTVIDLLRKASELKEEILEQESYPPTVYSAYDCTGKPFGSRFRKLDFTKTEGGFIALYVHGWAIDI